MEFHSARLSFRRFTLDDAAFIQEIVNDPGFLQNIGDRNVHSIKDAHRYLNDGPFASYAKNGFGLMMVELLDDGTPIGMCGLIRRDSLPHVDVGYAFLPAFCGQGFATEAAAAMIDYGRRQHGLTMIIAIVSPTNAASTRVLEKIGMKYVRNLTMPGETRETAYYSL